VGAGPLRHLQPWLERPNGPANGLLTVTAAGQLMYYSLADGALTSLVNSSLAVTGLAVTRVNSSLPRAIFIGDSAGWVHVMDSSFRITDSVAVCSGEKVEALEMFRSEASSTFKGAIS
jgi:hypothetical protein